MTISERTLRKWRFDALNQLHLISGFETDRDFEHAKKRKETSERILRLTQELLDQHLLRKVRC